MELTKIIIEAFELAHEVHRDQYRKKSTIPYLSHVMAVSSLIFENGGDEEQAAAGLLHDTVEDSGGRISLQNIHDRFGERIGKMVTDATDAEEDPKPPWKERKIAYIKNLKSLDSDSTLVIACDKYHNLHSVKEDFLVMGDEVWNKFSVPVEKSLWYYKKIFNEVGQRWPLRLSREYESNIEFLIAEYLKNGGDKDFFEMMEKEMNF